jgi:acyl-CoA synthetase (NDP forming)
MEARAAGKPMFCWLLGKCDEARNFHIHTQECGVPVYRELYRAVECMAAVFAWKKALERRKEWVS